MKDKVRRHYYVAMTKCACGGTGCRPVLTGYVCAGCGLYRDPRLVATAYVESVIKRRIQPKTVA